MITEGAIVAAAGVLGWAIRQEGRINGHDKLFIEREKQADDRHDDIKARLVRIETGIDSLAHKHTNP